MMVIPKTTQDIDVEREKGKIDTLRDPPRYASKALFSEGTEIHIDHNGALYTLRITRSGGLILNK